MIGVLLHTCIWTQKLSTQSKYPEAPYGAPLSLDCCRSEKLDYIKTPTGYEKALIISYLLHTDVVKTGDMLDGKEVAVKTLTDFADTIQGYKAVVLK